MSAEVARVPLRQIGGAESSSAASVRSISSSTTGIQRATTNGPSSTTVGASRPPVTWATAKRAEPGEPRQGVPTTRRRPACRTTRPPPRRDRGGRSGRTCAARSAVRARCARARRTRRACRASRSRRRSTGCGRTHRRATPRMRCSRRSTPRRAATPTATCPGRRARLAPATWVRRYRPGARSPDARFGGVSQDRADPSDCRRCRRTRPLGRTARSRGNETNSTSAATIRSYVRVEVVDAEEEADPAGRLLPDRRRLVVAVGAREQDAGLGAGWANHDPPFRAAVVGQRRGVLDQLEPEHIDEELDRRVVLLDDDRDQAR